MYDYVPVPDHATIRARCLEIQAGWDDDTRRARTSAAGSQGDEAQIDYGTEQDTYEDGYDEVPIGDVDVVDADGFPA